MACKPDWGMSTRPWWKRGTSHTQVDTDCNPGDGVSKFDDIPKICLSTKVIWPETLRYDDFASSRSCKQPILLTMACTTAVTPAVLGLEDACIPEL